VPSPMGSTLGSPVVDTSIPKSTRSSSFIPTASSTSNFTSLSNPASSSSNSTLSSHNAWAAPPRVLLVDDDAVSRNISIKFLQVFGCTTDVAVDGIDAVTKMNLEKYDLVFMVRFSLVLWFSPSIPFVFFGSFPHLLYLSLCLTLTLAPLAVARLQKC